MRLKENNQLKLISLLIAILLFLSVNEKIKKLVGHCGKQKHILKEKAKANPEPNVTMDYLQKQVKNLKAQVQRLEEINERYKQQFIVWQYNAYMHGMTQVTLNKPLIAVNRQRR